MSSKITARTSYLKKSDPGFTELSSAIHKALYKKIKSVLGPRCASIVEFSTTSEVSLHLNGKYLIEMQAFFRFVPTRATMRRFGLPKCFSGNMQRLHATGEFRTDAKGDPTSAAFELASLLLSNLVQQHDDLEASALSLAISNSKV